MLDLHYSLELAVQTTHLPARPKARKEKEEKERWLEKAKPQFDIHLEEQVKHQIQKEELLRQTSAFVVASQDIPPTIVLCPRQLLPQTRDQPVDQWKAWQLTWTWSPSRTKLAWSSSLTRPVQNVPIALWWILEPVLSCQDIWPIPTLCSMSDRGRLQGGESGIPSLSTAVSFRRRCFDGMSLDGETPSFLQWTVGLCSALPPARGDTHASWTTYSRGTWRHHGLQEPSTSHRRWTMVSSSTWMSWRISSTTTGWTGDLQPCGVQGAWLWLGGPWRRWNYWGAPNLLGVQWGGECLP